MGAWGPARHGEAEAVNGMRGWLCVPLAIASQGPGAPMFLLKLFSHTRFSPLADHFLPHTALQLQ